MHAFIHGWASHSCCKLRVYLHVSCSGPCSPEWHPSWHLSPCVSLIIIAPSRCLYLCKYEMGTKPENCQKLYNITILLMRAHFMLWEQFIRPSLKAMRTPLTRPLQGYGNTASLSYLDTWVRKPDYLHLPHRDKVKGKGI